jgi:hypothetical protein
VLVERFTWLGTVHAARVFVFVYAHRDLAVLVADGNFKLPGSHFKMDVVSSSLFYGG